MRKYNIVLIVLDSLREDYAQELEKLRELGFVKYENVYATAPWTLPSHVSMFTGMYPSEHGIHETREYNSWEKIAKLSRIRMAKLGGGILGQLKAEGYTTYIITANPIVSSIYGFKADHEYVIDPITTRMVDSRNNFDEMYEKLGSRAKVALHLIKNLEINEFINAFSIFTERRLHRLYATVYKLPKYISERYVLDKGGKRIVRLVNELKFEKPFFLFINLMEAHCPYTKHDVNDRKLHKYVGEWLATGTVNPEAFKIWRNYPLHAQEAAKRAIEVVETLKRKGHWDDTLIIVTADHGELLGDGGLHHIYSLLDGNLRVPLYVKYPGKPKKQRGYITLADIPQITDPTVDEIGRTAVIAETYGIQVSFKVLKISNEEKYYHHKIRIISSKFDFIYNRRANSIEKIFRGNIDDIRIFLGNR